MFHPRPHECSLAGLSFRSLSEAKGCDIDFLTWPRGSNLVSGSSALWPLGDNVKSEKSKIVYWIVEPVWGRQNPSKIKDENIFLFLKTEKKRCCFFNFNMNGLFSLWDFSYFTLRHCAEHKVLLHLSRIWMINGGKLTLTLIQYLMWCPTWLIIDVVISAVDLADIVVILSAAKIVSVNMRLTLCPWLGLCNYNDRSIKINFFRGAGMSSHSCHPRLSLSCLSSLTLQSSKLKERPHRAPKTHRLPRILHQSCISPLAQSATFAETCFQQLGCVNKCQFSEKTCSRSVSVKCLLGQGCPRPQRCGLHFNR